MHVISFCNSKGGVAKSTTSVNVAAGLVKRGFKVLLLDLDSQGSATHYVGVEVASKYKAQTVGIKSIADYFYRPEQININNIDTLGIVPIKPKFDLLRGSTELALLDLHLSSITEWYLYVNSILTKVGEGYDFVVIDTPPALSGITINAFIASDTLIIVSPPLSLDVMSLHQLLDEISEIRRLAPAGIVKGVLLTRTRKVKTMQAHAKYLRKKFNELIFTVEIKESIIFPESASNKMDIFQYKPRSAGARQYKDFISELLFRIL